MGQDNSTGTTPAPPRGAARPPASAAPPQPVAYQPLQIETPTVYRANGEETQPPILTAELARAVVNQLPPSCLSGGMYTKQKWVLLYDSSKQGKSFQTLIQSITKKGPVLIVIKVANSDRIIGGFCEADWQSVADREKEAVSRAAAAKRAARTGYNSNAGGTAPPAGQHNVFFGSDGCFLFRSSSQAGTTTATYNSRPSMNTNFMYLFDTHPDGEKIGIGMGGQPGYFGWYLDRWLETGYCHGSQCTTFGNPRLTETESWHVEAVEAYAVSRDAVNNLTSGAGTKNAKASVLDKNNTETTTNQFMMEAYGLHKFDQNEREECGLGPKE